MRKIAALFMVACLGLALVGTLGGCGGGDNEADRAEAKELMVIGDAWMDEAEANFEILNEARQEMRGAMPGGEESEESEESNGDIDEEEMEKFMEEMEATSESMVESLEGAEASFQAIMDLDDAADYKEYAGVMLELIAEYEQFASMQGNMGGRPGEEGMPRMGDGPPSDGTPPEDMGFPEGMEPPEDGEAGGFRGNMTEQIESLKAEAADIKKGKNL
ncbi:MAG: hypothetical protein SWK76_16060 [Actinomycetota bacterium]|nr:hypothetical protein [Actinomycetota bacterium]